MNVAEATAENLREGATSKKIQESEDLLEQSDCFFSVKNRHMVLDKREI